ncbi:MAG: hypothetical protein WAO08_16350 [Hyphomicrobiaceae bacterium]
MLTVYYTVNTLSNDAISLVYANFRGLLEAGVELLDRLVSHEARDIELSAGATLLELPDEGEAGDRNLTKLRGSKP